METLVLSPYAADVLNDLRPMLAAFAGLLGLIVGSFLNVVIHRVPAGLSVVAPRSACPSCHTPIAARDNVPVLSWLLLRAKCRTCATAISARYPAVEATTAVLFAGLTWWALGQSPAMVPATAPALLYVTAIGIALFMIDLDTFRLPDGIVKPAYAVTTFLLAGAGWLAGEWTGYTAALMVTAVAVASAALAAFDHWDARTGYALPEAVAENAWPVGALALALSAVLAGTGVLSTIGGAALVWLAVFWIPRLATRGRAMGLGDVKLAPVLGALLGAFGWGPALVGLMAAFAFGALIGVALICFGTADRKAKVPFGPYMLLGALFGVVAGESLFGLYLRVSGIA